MKRIHLLLAALGLVFFVTSCKNTMDVSKRRYTKGYHFEKHKSPSSPQEGVASQNSKETVPVMEPVAQSLPTGKASVPEVKGEIRQNENMTGFAEKSKRSDIKSIPAAEAKKAAEETHVTSKPAKQGSHIQQKASRTGSGAMDSDVKLILLIILALFIPPLAMYLWDKQTDVWFIVDLVLFLLLFTWFFFPFGLVGLAAILIAILRILELL